MGVTRGEKEEEEEEGGDPKGDGDDGELGRDRLIPEAPVRPTRFAW